MAEDDLRSGLLGTLRSELDDSETGLERDFETLASLCGSVRTAFLSFRVNPEQAGRLFSMLRLTGSDGQEWTVGASTGGWFRRRLGETDWVKAQMPLGVQRAGDAPSWLISGIAAELAAAEAATRDAENRRAQEDAETGRESRDPFAEGSINPFQRKDVDGIAVPDGQAPRPASAADVDLDWLTQEWEEFDRKVAAQRTAGEARRPALPSELPEDLDPERALSAGLENRPGPVDRPREEVGGAPVDRRTVSPEEFFLPPED